MNLLFVSLIANAFLLGLRHGIDWDHIAAILDIVGTTETLDTVVREQSSGCLQRANLLLSLFYVLGHALVVLLLGLGAILFAAALPAWIDPIMERIVGLTLLFLGLWVFYSLARSFLRKEDFKPISRWMLVWGWSKFIWQRLIDKLSSERERSLFRVEPYGPRTAFTVGVIHGVGAETGTQVLLIAAVGEAAKGGAGIGMLLSFVAGMAMSNTLVAALGSTGFISSSKFRPTYLTLSAATGLFSLIIGLFFALGQGNSLPSLQHLFGA